MTFDDQWASDFRRRINERMGFGGFTPDWVSYDDGPFQRFYTGSPGDTAAPRYVEPGLANVYRCTCGCSEVTHQLPGGHCLVPCCKDEPCTVKTPDPLVEMIQSWL